MTIPVIDDSQILEGLKAQQNPFFKDYYAFYSSWFRGITKNPYLMLLPIDDHMVHRGDGIFEGLKAVGRSVYLLEEHLQRLARSAEKIQLQLPFSLEKIREILLETLRAANKNDVMIRIYVSRGPGNFNANPYESVGPQLYMAVSRLTYPSDEKYLQGVSIGQSAILAKPPWQAQIKSCNYLPNVLMKKEAVDRGLDFVVGIDHRGGVTESATENIMMVDAKGTLVHPPLENILKGTTMIRAFELARENGLAAEERFFTVKDLLSAREVMMAGTTLDVLPVVEFEKHKIADGKPGLIAKKLQKLMIEDMKSGHRGLFY